MTRIFVIAGEESGDIIGGDLLHQIKQAYPDCLIAGIGGTRMEQAGAFQSLFPLSDLSVMGLAEVIVHLPRLLQRIKHTKKAIQNFQPDLLLTIDAPDFCLRIAKWVKAKQPAIKTIHTVAPTVWAWRAGRAKKIAKFLDGLLCLFPFEPSYFTPHGLQAQFIGHPLAHMIMPVPKNAKQLFFDDYHLDPDKRILCLLPGSRMREINALLPIFLQTAARVRQSHPDLQIILPTLPRLQTLVETHLLETDLPVTLIMEQADKYTAMQCSTASLHASGTVALELALCGTPMVTAYQVSPLSAWLARQLLKVQSVNLINILAGDKIIPEYLQESCTVGLLTPAVNAVLSDKHTRELQIEALQQVKKRLQVHASAVDFIKQYITD